MIKYVLILHLCTYFGQVVCTSQKVMPYEYTSYHDCITQGYVLSYKEMMEMDKVKVEQDKIAIKFQCRQVEVPEVNS